MGYICPPFTMRVLCGLARRGDEPVELLPPDDLDKLIARISGTGNRYAPSSGRRWSWQPPAGESCTPHRGPGTGKTTSLRGVLALFETWGWGRWRPPWPGGKRLGAVCGTRHPTIRLLETG